MWKTQITAYHLYHLLLVTVTEKDGDEKESSDKAHARVLLGSLGERRSPGTPQLRCLPPKGSLHPRLMTTRNYRENNKILPLNLEIIPQN